ncbi:MAG TPA: hypothetical protein VFQ61_02905 [Polyangiaceae bacterium]|nr:hypothetical protein [Polyangiaceae bacterium]
MERVKLATLWLGGCSGCHMSFLDLDEFLLELTQFADIVYSPVIDRKDYPEGVDIALVEGAVANVEHLEIIAKVRERTRLLVAFGDCAVTGNVTALRNPLGHALPVLDRAYLQDVAGQPRIPGEPGIIPALLDHVLPVHEVVKVDGFLTGCPPEASRIRKLIEQLLAGGAPGLSGRDLSFG